MNQTTFDTFINYMQAQDFNSAAQLLKNLSEQETAQALQALWEFQNFAVNSVSVLKRELKDGHSYNDFHTAWLPPLDKKDITTTSTGVSAHYFPYPVRVINAINIANDKEIISIGLMHLKKEDILKMQSANSHHQDNSNLPQTNVVRHDQIGEVANKIGETIFFECKDDNRLGF